MALRFKLDENVPGEAVASLRDAGHDVSTVLDQRMGGRPDAEVLNACRHEARILVTLDLGFGDIHNYPPASHEGVWVLRPVAHGIASVLRMLQQALALAATEPSARRLWVIGCASETSGDNEPAGSRDIEDIFRDLIALSRSLTEEQDRHVREHLSEEQLTIFDILTRPGPDLTGNAMKSKRSRGNCWSA